MKIEIHMIANKCWTFYVNIESYANIYTCMCNIYFALFIDKSTYTDMYLVHFGNAHEIYLYDVMPRC